MAERKLTWQKLIPFWVYQTFPQALTACPKERSGMLSQSGVGGYYWGRLDLD